LFPSRFTSFGSALLFSVAPLWLSATTYPKTHSIAMFFSLLAGWLVLEAGEKDSWKYLIGSGLCAGIAIATRPIDGAFILIPFAMLYIAPRIKNKKLVFNKNKLSLINIAGFCIPFIGILLILMGPRVMMFGGISGFLAMMKIETRGGWLGLFSVQLPVSFSYMNTTITYLGWIGVLGGVSYLLKKRRIYTLSVLGVWFAIMFFYIGNLTVVDSRFLIPVLAPLCILMAFGCEWGYEKHKIIGIAALIVLMGSLFYVAHPLIKARHEYSGQKEFAEFVEMSTEPNSLVYSGDNYVFITRYGHRNTKYFGGGEENVNFMINTLLNKTNVYAVESSFYFMTPVERDLLSKYFIISYIGHAQNEVYQFSALQLRRYDEKLFKINLNETALQELVKSQDNAENGVQ
ncbi:MAG: glycosyltransferase family 39 protein, partial [Nanoarchaeota archaeon]|nr:glycosyltransferase family 39 protein [Nanoarchaeota archaeon]